MNFNPFHRAMRTTDLPIVNRDARQHKQRNLWLTIKHELYHPTFEGVWVQETFCPADSRIVNNVIHTLKKKYIFTNSHKFALKDWPKARAGEKAFYQPFVKMLNGIVGALRAHYPEESLKSISRIRCSTSTTKTCWVRSIARLPRGQIFCLH